MSDLGCDVTTCAYNESHGCKREDIRIGGEAATSSCGTNCSSFCDEDSDRVTAAYNSEVTGRTDIQCEAVNCVNNEGRKCQADHVDVAGDRAIISDETECATFVSR